MKRKNNYWWLMVLSIVMFVGVWWLCCDVLKMTKSSTLPGPVTIGATFIKKLTSTAPDGATLPEHIFSSLKIAMGGWAMGVIIASVEDRSGDTSMRQIPGTMLYDLQEDPEQLAPIHNPEAEQRLIRHIIQLMEENDAPEEQYVRLGLR
ncbi:MAG: hypothetical protein LBQ71_08895 [Hungatella sp.]|nr:hypothetical protein [Hungatella sp.]